MTRFVGVPKARLTAPPPAKALYLIYGDEIEDVGAIDDTKTTVRHRGREGSMATSSLDGEPMLECYFLDVGQGDATLIVTPGRKKILIDGGASPTKGATGEAELALTWKYELDADGPPVVIDLVVLSHADNDHIGGLISLVHSPKIIVKKVIHSGIATYNAPDEDDQLGDVNPIDGRKYLVTRHDTLDELDASDLSETFSAWKAILELNGVAYEAVQAGDIVDVGDPTIHLEVLGPVVEGTVENPRMRWFGDKAHTINGHSVVLRLTYKDVRVLLSGDVNIEGSELLLEDPDRRAKLDAEILKAPHHGSHEFTHDFLAAVNPQITTISSGEIPDHGHPRANFLGAVGAHSRGQEPLIFSTALSALYTNAEQAGDQATIDAHSDLASFSVRRALFRKRLAGIVNVRTNGDTLFAATRVQTAYWWVSFGPLPRAPRSPVPDG